MALCIIAAGKTVAIATTAFTLSWTHSVEKVRWEEDWQVKPAGLQLVEARIRGSGAGMEPPPGSVLRDGWWVYVPDLPPQPEISLAASGATPSPWSLCAEGRCMTLGAEAGDPVVLRSCDGQER